MAKQFTSLNKIIKTLIFYCSGKSKLFIANSSYIDHLIQVEIEHLIPVEIDHPNFH